MAVSDSSKGACFLFINSSRRLEFLLRVDGFGFFLTGSFPLVSKEREVSRAKAKPEPTVRENLKSKPWLISVWQRSRHLEARADSLSHIVVILL